MPANPAPDQKPVAVNEATLAKLYGFSHETAYRLRKAGMPHVRLPEGGIVYLIDSVTTWMKQFETSESEGASYAKVFAAVAPGRTTSGK